MTQPFRDDPKRARALHRANKILTVVILWHIHACFCGCCGRRICGYIKPSVCRWTDLLLWRLCGPGSTGTAVWNIWTAICDSKRYERTFLAEPACVFRGSDCVYVLVCVPGCGNCIFAYDSCYCMDPGSFRSALYQWCSGGISFCCVFSLFFSVVFTGYAGKITGFLSGTGAVSCCILFEHPVKIGKIFKTGFRRNIQNGGVGSCQQTRGDCQAVVPQIVHERRSHSFFEIPHKMRFGKINGCRDVGNRYFCM